MFIECPEVDSLAVSAMCYGIGFSVRNTSAYIYVIRTATKCLEHCRYSMLRGSIIIRPAFVRLAPELCFCAHTLTSSVDSPFNCLAFFVCAGDENKRTENCVCCVPFVVFFLVCATHSFVHAVRVDFWLDARNSSCTRAIAEKVPPRSCNRYKIDVITNTAAVT